jgi:hypothetical protein
LEKTVNLKLKDVDFRKSRFRTYFGNIGEMIAEEILLKEGFTVWGFRPYHDGGSKQNTMPFYDNLYFCMNFLYESNERCYDEGLTYEETREKGIGLLKDFFGEKLVYFKKYLESIGVIGKTSIVGWSQIKMTEPQPKHVYTPDLVAKKGKEIYVVEVKTNSGNIHLKPEKVQGLLSARKFGLIPLIVHMNIDIKASDFSIQELS